MTRKRLIQICLGLTIAGALIQHAGFIIGTPIEGYSLMALVALAANGLVTNERKPK